MARTKLIAGNWKMNTNLASATSLAAGVQAALGSETGFDVAVFPPFPYLLAVREALAGSKVILGAQDLCAKPDGAFTGEVSTAMLKDCGCTSVLVGHSERRHTLKDPVELLPAKIQTALAADLQVIYCVGELEAEREANRTNEVLSEQMRHDLAGLEATGVAKLVVAYEPVWAIGTGKVATPQQAQEAHAYIRGWLETRFGAAVATLSRILYGGSVKPDNAAEILNLPDVDGVLVGGASLKADGFAAIAAGARG